MVKRACSDPMHIVPVNLKNRDAFHLTIEEYLHALITLIEELVRVCCRDCSQRPSLILHQARLAVNSVTLGDYQRPIEISQFVKDLHAGFQILNLKNDSLRRRSDGIKYNVSIWDTSTKTMPLTAVPTGEKD